ncbi:hypothetical protein RS694_13430 [Rhodoferax saidenbachensis]|uniref:Uncharacterized protein n=1 Tax=Rhodoferax saidenbachensis TaxID=1484693 RepID=A0A1P8KBP7_9BURK|nr:hypothetical protein RS694_13430 [Rhodoferax saidenbachensis]
MGWALANGLSGSLLARLPKVSQPARPTDSNTDSTVPALRPGKASAQEERGNRVIGSKWDMGNFSAGEALEERQPQDDTTLGARTNRSFEGRL